MVSSWKPVSRLDSTGTFVVSNNLNNVGTELKFAFILVTGKEGNCKEDFKFEDSAEEEGISVSDAMAQLKFEGEAVKKISKTSQQTGGCGVLKALAVTGVNWKPSGKAF